MGYVCVEHVTTPATIIITMLEDGTTIGLCGECVHPWAAGIAAATDPEAIQEAKARIVLEGEAERQAEADQADLDAAVADPASTEDWTHPLDRAEAAAERLDELGDPEGQPEAPEALTAALDGPEWPRNEPAEV